jgi:eukaryotic-like serine/threonine-protein kinase
MSPEQAQGQPADARSDIDSFGLVLYEMLSGKRAFSGDSNYSVMDAIVRKDPTPLQSTLALDAIVRRCLAKQPLARYQTMTELKTALERASTEKTPVGVPEPQPSIAVLPFVNMSGDREQEYFSDGLAEEIINALTNLPGLRVAGRTSSGIIDWNKPSTSATVQSFTSMSNPSATPCAPTRASMPCSAK